MLASGGTWPTLYLTCLQLKLVIRACYAKSCHEDVVHSSPLATTSLLILTSLESFIIRVKLWMAKLPICYTALWLITPHTSPTSDASADTQSKLPIKKRLKSKEYNTIYYE